MSEGLIITGTAIHESIRSILNEGRRRAGAQINSIMVETYWRIGERIVLEEQQGTAKAEYGQFLLQGLSRVLSSEFGKGFSYANLRNFCQFYLTWPDWENCYTLCSKLSWSHNRLIMREDDEAVRLWYLGHATEGNWTVRQLDRQIKTRIIDAPLAILWNFRHFCFTHPIAKKGYALPSELRGADHFLWPNGPSFLSPGQRPGWLAPSKTAA